MTGQRSTGRPSAPKPVPSALASIFCSAAKTAKTRIIVEIVSFTVSYSIKIIFQIAQALDASFRVCANSYRLQADED